MDIALTDTSRATTTEAGILVVDDDVSARKTLVSLLESVGYGVTAVGNAEEAADIMRRSSIDLVLTDLRLPGIDGIDLLRQLQRADNRVLGIVLTGYGSVTEAVRAMKAGAFDFITKPFDLDAVEVSVQRAVEFLKLKEENYRLHLAVRDKYRFENLVGNSPAMWAVYELIEKVADTDSTILLSGESGTGKEVVAKTIHYNSYRREKPLIPVNCGAIPEHLLESELFGHERGAFTGAVASRIGRFERADGGTIFLDEVAEMSLPLQVKLLRVLQERSFERVGGNRTIHVDIRVIAATNRSLQQAVANKQFRDDLYYCLNVIPIDIPPLRDRVSDIPMLVDHCLAKFRHAQRS
ncbi:MAG TPA: sigma-54-dependent Fis family transcriptional regulator, partial [Nitrospirales bacterium]|nr:sigma-54-dependent Fis family transcriptional regulator [Nitrospirales bacterium]